MLSRCLYTCLLLASAAMAGAEVHAVGEARDRLGGALLYREYHLQTDTFRGVQYFDAGGALIAVNTLLPGPTPSAPGYVQRDLRSGVCQSVQWRDQRLLLSFRGRDRWREPTLPVVLSAGFDAFVRAHLDDLRAGSTMPFDFALPSRLELVRLEVGAADHSEVRLTPADPDWLLLRIRPASRLLSLFVAAIELAYDRSGRLRVYRGLSNLAAPGGGSWDVRIDYNYDAVVADLSPAGDRDLGAFTSCATEENK